MRRWLIPLAAALMLASAQPVLAGQVKPGVVRTIADTDNPQFKRELNQRAAPGVFTTGAPENGRIGCELADEVPFMVSRGYGPKNMSHRPTLAAEILEF